MTKLLLIAIFLVSNTNTFSQQSSDSILTSFNFNQIKIVELSRSKSSNPDDSNWNYEEAKKTRSGIFNMQLTTKYRDWENPSTGGAIHINAKDEIEIYKFTLGIYQYTNDTASYYSDTPKDTSVIVKREKIWNNVMGLGEGEPTSILITSEFDLNKSESIKVVMSEVYNRGTRIYYIIKTR